MWDGLGEDQATWRLQREPWTPAVSSHWAHIYTVAWEGFTQLEGGPNKWHRNLGWQDSLSRNDLTHNKHEQSTPISPQKGRRPVARHIRPTTLYHSRDWPKTIKPPGVGMFWDQLQGSVKQSSVCELQPYLVVFNVIKTLQMFSSLKILGIRSCSILFPCSRGMSWEPQNSRETGVFNHRPGTTLTAFCRKFPETTAEQQGLQQAGYPASSQQRNTQQPLWPGLWTLGTKWPYSPDFVHPTNLCHQHLYTTYFTLYRL